MRGVLYIHDDYGPKGTGTMEARLEAMVQEVFRCKGMVERGLNANHLMITDLSRDLKVDGKPMKDIIFTLNEQINFLQSQIYDLQNQVFEYEARFKGMSLLLAAGLVRLTPPFMMVDHCHGNPRTRSLLHHLHHLLHHQRKIEFRVWALPLASAKLGGGAPVSYHPHYLFAFTYFSSIFCFR